MTYGEPRPTTTLKPIDEAAAARRHAARMFRVFLILLIACTVVTLAVTIR